MQYICCMQTFFKKNYNIIMNYKKRIYVLQFSPNQVVCKVHTNILFISGSHFKGQETKIFYIRKGPFTKVIKMCVILSRFLTLQRNVIFIFIQLSLYFRKKSCKYNGSRRKKGTETQVLGEKPSLRGGIFKIIPSFKQEQMDKIVQKVKKTNLLS